MICGTYVCTVFGLAGPAGRSAAFTLSAARAVSGMDITEWLSSHNNSPSLLLHATSYDVSLYSTVAIMLYCRHHFIFVIPSLSFCTFMARMRMVLFDYLKVRSLFNAFVISFFFIVMAVVRGIRRAVVEYVMRDLSHAHISKRYDLTQTT